MPRLALLLGAAAAATAAAQTPTPFPPAAAVGRNIMPRAVGHRGIPAVYPENTKISFVAALAAGADGIESDLHLTADNVLVLIHDATLDRTTNCTGYVKNYTLAELASCNANYAAVFGNQWGFQPIPTFEEIVVLVAEAQAFFVLDLKEGALLGQYIRPVVDKYAAASLMVMSCWTFPQVADAVMYMNVSARQLLNETAWGATGEAGSALNPGSPNGLTPAQSLPVWESLRELGISGFSLELSSLTPIFVQQAHARLMPVFVWTVDDEADINAAVNMGVDGILTNTIPTLLSVLQPRATAAINWRQTPNPTITSSTLGLAIAGTAVAGLIVGSLLTIGYRYARARKNGARIPGTHSDTPLMVSVGVADA